MKTSSHSNILVDAMSESYALPGYLLVVWILTVTFAFTAVLSTMEMVAVSPSVYQLVEASKQTMTSKEEYLNRNCILVGSILKICYRGYPLGAIP